VVKLLGYDYDIEYKQGRENVPADALSRIPSHELFALTTSTISTSLMEEIRSSYHNDPMIQTIIKDLQGSADSHPHYAWVHNHLNRKGKVVVGHNMALHSQIISVFHNSAVGGHSGMTMTSKTVGSLFYWKGQQKYIRQYVRECIVCQRNKHENVASPGLLQPLPIPIAPFIDISMDFVEGLPKSEGKDVIMVIVDRFSKYAHYVATPMQHLQLLEHSWTTSTNSMAHRPLLPVTETQCFLAGFGKSYSTIKESTSTILLRITHKRMARPKW
jgi:hypothetical protein